MATEGDNHLSSCLEEAEDQVEVADPWHQAYRACQAWAEVGAEERLKQNQALEEVGVEERLSRTRALTEVGVEAEVEDQLRSQAFDQKLTASEAVAEVEVVGH